MTTAQATTETQRRERYIRSLLRERELCQRDGKKARVAAINAELGETAKDAELPNERAQKRPLPPSRRTSR